ncbi:hypothetical protein [Collinsella aerofaciens]|uniref:hypothetical protein n=2 Tax=Collinsella aerofaciens TaxID=74426 RepID=UPI001106A214|nr:hypothetical protein [Collinsella aerofaciens]MBS6079514.1 hypothetical protein [Collinsella sp.]MDB1805045.1 hypothetical protein [Collinsella aerofaciens]MDB1809728.1 hypothetical protein [Collinsella aerofaciens]MDB1811724.1 hypothetical protein [Collinsella aerofaciens]MDB1905360.1 hypothetical protein [Collinsella aerofaciens]
MKWNELAELICAFISLFVTVIIGKKQSCQSKRMEELERRQDERDERRHAEGNKAQAIEFISKHYADRGLIPLCAVAAMHNDLFHYSRKMYWEFCCLVPEVQNLILEFCNLDLRVRGEDDLFVRCITAVEAALRDRFPEDESVLYDDGKYVLRSLERYAGERLPALRVDLLPECLDSSFLPPDSCTLEYDHLIRKVLSEAFESRDASFTPISHLKNEYQFESSSEIEACRFASTVAFYAATYGSGDEANNRYYGCPGGFDGERIETMEDLFLLTVFQIYTKLLLPNEG